MAKNILKSISPQVGKSNESSRNRWLEKVLSAVPPNSRILDAGAGTQRCREFCKHLNYVSQDFGEYDGKGDAAGIHGGYYNYGKLDIVSDITSVPEPDVSFDAIMCIEVLEHLPDPSLAIKEFARLLKPNGYLILTAPFCSLTHLSPYHFSTGFNKYWYEKYLPGNKFKLIEITANGNFFEYIAQEINRISSVSSRYSKRKPRLYERLCMLVIKYMLQRFSKIDKGSSELLCFGYHVFAQKL